MSKILFVLLCIIDIINGNTECRLQKMRPRFQSHYNVHTTSILKFKKNSTNVSHIPFHLTEIII